MKKKTIKFFRTQQSTLLIGLGTLFFFILISNENIFKEYTPRRLCMFNEVRLISVHFISNFAIGMSYIFIGVNMFKIYKAFKDVQLPWKGFIWMYAAFIFMCGLTHFINVLNLFVTFYWIDGLLGMITAFISVSVAFTLQKDIKNIIQLNPEIYKNLVDRFDQIQKIYEETKNDK